MNDDILNEISCPNCLNAIDIRGHEQHVACDACGSQFLLEGHVCPACGAYHRSERTFCRECGQSLTRTCQKCQASNWAGDEYCHNCGAALDIFEMLQKVDAESRAERERQRLAMIRELKEKDEAASQRRMAEMMAAEEARLAELARRQAENRRRDQMVLGAVAIGVVIFLLLVLVFVLM